MYKKINYKIYLLILFLFSSGLFIFNSSLAEDKVKDSSIIFGKEKLIKKKNFKVSNFEIRFHLLPNIKITKLQDNKSVLIELENSGWRLFSNDGLIGIETGLYFGNKNQYIENQNIFISGITQSDEQVIEWQISKI